MKKRKPAILLSTGYEVQIEEDDYKTIDHLTNAILGEIMVKYGKTSTSWDTILKMMSEEIDYVVTTNITREDVHPEIKEKFTTALLGYIVRDKLKNTFDILRKEEKSKKKKLKGYNQ